MAAWSGLKIGKIKLTERLKRAYNYSGLDYQIIDD